MSRSGYSDDCEQWDLIRWRGAVASAIRGTRGQALLLEMAEVLDSMPNKRLIAEDLVNASGDVCALGAVACARGMNVASINPEDSYAVASAFGIAPALAKEIAFENDDDFAGAWRNETPEHRWIRVRAWVSKQIKP
jgi:hypothetical protein